MILGRVVEHETGNALPGVTVSVRNTPFRTVSDDIGRFSFIQMESGSYHLTFQSLGYAERSEAVELSPDASAEIEVRLSVAPVNLPPIAVMVRSGSLAAWLASRGFAKRGLGGTAMLHVDYDELRMTHHRNLNDVLRNVAGVRIRELADQDAEFLLEPDPRTGAGSCKVSVYLNGSNVEFGWSSWVGNADAKRRTDPFDRATRRLRFDELVRLDAIDASSCKDPGRIPSPETRRAAHCSSGAGSCVQPWTRT